MSGSRCTYSTACVILPHLGVQLTPERHSGSREQAEQVAALCAVLYLEGVIGIHSHGVRVVPVGFPHLLQPEQLHGWEDRTRQRALWTAQQKEILVQRLDQKRQQLAAELAELERAQAAIMLGSRPPLRRAAALLQQVVSTHPSSGSRGGIGSTFGAIGRGGGGRGGDEGEGEGGEGDGGGGGGGGGGGDAEALADALAAALSGRAPKRARVGVSAAASASQGWSPSQGTTDGSSVGTAAAAAAAGMHAHGMGSAAQDKSNVQQLKEVCDRRRWVQPSYEYAKDQRVSGYVCRLSLPDARAPSLAGLSSEPQPNKKRAKEAAAGAALRRLAELFAGSSAGSAGGRVGASQGAVAMPTTAPAAMVAEAGASGSSGHRPH
ncbi:hypothetical protein FOA52_003663 [Chlamydomonas sp. UWO 241]|nr:hypothetical protein FOA52_003663 [Chlamydomonas sp. UWO 241]